MRSVAECSTSCTNLSTQSKITTHRHTCIFALPGSLGFGILPATAEDRVPEEAGRPCIIIAFGPTLAATTAPTSGAPAPATLSGMAFSVKCLRHVHQGGFVLFGMVCWINELLLKAGQSCGKLI